MDWLYEAKFKIAEAVQSAIWDKREAVNLHITDEGVIELHTHPLKVTVAANGLAIDEKRIYYPIGRVAVTSFSCFVSGMVHITRDDPDPVTIAEELINKLELKLLACV
ncbi:hypothetical protein [Dongshaea marina]|uniref:hypothetical protein n=1 Tax=Dongshaea marina TaxID=2047966 RepID=UPI000D3EDAE5|nr:hypothetical protein [Dongshaea marina]